MNKTVKLNNFEFSNYDKLSLIAGPCVLESNSHANLLIAAARTDLIVNIKRPVFSSIRHD